MVSQCVKSSISVPYFCQLSVNLNLCCSVNTPIIGSVVQQLCDYNSLHRKGMTQAITIISVRNNNQMSTVVLLDNPSNVLSVLG
jgi:hypothetical protein